MSAQRGMRFTCDQTWEAMESQGSDRFCDRCANPVIDFTNTERTTLLKFYEAEPGTCGRFTLEQLEPDLVPLPAVHRQLLKGAISVLAVLALHTSNAQSPTAPGPATEQTTGDRRGQEQVPVELWEKCWIEKDTGPITATATPVPKVRYYVSTRFPFVHKRRQFRVIGCPSF